MSFTSLNTLCVIEDQRLRILIGVGEWRDEIYYFQDAVRIHALNVDGITSLSCGIEDLVIPRKRSAISTLY